MGDNGLPDLMQRLMAINVEFSRRFPDHNEPFHIMTRLLEECGEPGRAKLAKEVFDVLHCTLQIAQHCGVESELEAAIERSYQRLKSEGFIH